MAAGYSTAAVSMGHLALKRAIRHAKANDLVSRNVAVLADTPKGQQGRPSKSLTLDQAAALTTTARTLPGTELRPGLKDVRRPAELMHAYICARRISQGGSVDAIIGDNISPLTLPGQELWSYPPPRAATGSRMPPRRALPRRPARRIRAVTLSGTAHAPSRSTQARRVEHSRRSSRAGR
jgi:hypothetical protein